MAMPQLTMRTAFNTLLVATDFSSRSQAALSCAAALARKSNAKVLIAHVINPDKWQLVPPNELHPALRNERRTREKKMAHLLKSDELRGLRTDTVMKEGDFRRVLCAVAHERHADLLVAGTHGRQGLSKLLFGSRIEEVCHTAPCPILLVGPKVKEPQCAKLEKILFTTDLSPFSLGALPLVLAFAAQYGSHLRVARVLPEHEETKEADARKFAVTQLKTELAPAITTRAGLYDEPDFVVGYGAPKETILQMAGEWGADLIGMGADRPGSLAVYLPGDLAYEVACDAHCPVLTVIG